MDEKLSPYKVSSFKTFRRHCKDRVLQLADMRLTILARYVRISSKDEKTAEELHKLLSHYDVLIQAEEVFFIYLTNVIKEHDNG